VTRFSRFKW